MELGEIRDVRLGNEFINRQDAFYIWCNHAFRAIKMC